MKNRNLPLIVLALVVTSLGARAQANGSCAELANLKIDGVQITGAISVP